MNWKDINYKNPNAFLEWVKSWQPNAEYLTIVGEAFSIKIKDWMCRSFEYNMPPIEKLPHYFDTLEIHVDIQTFVYPDSTYFMYSVTQSYRVIDCQDEYTDRLSALEAGVIKAFELREEQL